MDHDDLYSWLLGGSRRELCDAFDAHLAAAIISRAELEARAEGSTLAFALGLDRAELARWTAEVFPHAEERLAALMGDDPVVRTQDEEAVRDLLVRCATLGTDFQRGLASVLARRALRPNHLWQDLGLRNRNELSWLMGRHFEWLASKNRHNMKWKKFLYRAVCLDGAYPICVAPSCSECPDHEDCFGQETGGTT